MMYSPFKCPKLPSIPLNWPDVDAAFDGVPGLDFRQAWRETPEARFRPAVARLAYHDRGLCVLAELEDIDVFNPVSGFNQPAFLEGDVVEVFVHSNVDRYYEIHAAPNGALLQLKLPVGWQKMTPSPFKGNPWDDAIASPVTRVMTRLTSNGWSAFLDIPFELLNAHPKSGSLWSFAICRYDYTKGWPDPVLSSSAALSKIDFHQITNWDQLVFV
ncbi:MAG: hypothetical protein PHD76_13220 [Methylacidiphilales bacterium]|nr:hypothetical protein [Candidatus Methylacidiphilales bacterium]